MKKILVFILSISICINCSEGDTTVPKAQTLKLPEGNTVSLQALKSSINRLDEEIITFTDKDQFTEGFVISSDQEGNFFKELILQDHYQNPTTGICVLIDERALYQRYPLGAKVRIRLEGLSIGFKNGVVKLGVLQGNEIEPIDFSSIDNHVFRTNIIEELTPLALRIEQITKDSELLYVSLNNMQFGSQLINPLSKTIAGEINDNFDALRPLQQCPSNLELILCTSTFSSFKNVTVPKDSGKIQGVLTRDFRDDFFVIKMNSIEDLNFFNQERCEPVFFNCAEATIDELTLVFKEDFEEITNEAKLEPLGWFNINVTGDEKRWQDRKVTNVDNRTLTISAFNSNLRPLEAWLITPEINLENSTRSVMSVRVRTRFNNGNALSIWITNNYTADPLTTNWMLLPVEIPYNSSNFKTLTQNISCLEGKVRVAFQYKGFDPIITSTYEIDDLKFYSN